MVYVNFVTGHKFEMLSNCIQPYILSLASQPYFSSCARMRVREGGGGKEGKIRLVTYARFSFPIGM